MCRFLATGALSDRNVISKGLRDNLSDGDLSPQDVKQAATASQVANRSVDNAILNGSAADARRAMDDQRSVQELSRSVTKEHGSDADPATRNIIDDQLGVLSFLNTLGDLTQRAKIGLKEMSASLTGN